MISLLFWELKIFLHTFVSSGFEDLRSVVKGHEECGVVGSRPSSVAETFQACLLSSITKKVELNTSFVLVNLLFPHFQRVTEDLLGLCQALLTVKLYDHLISLLKLHVFSIYLLWIFSIKL